MKLTDPRVLLAASSFCNLMQVIKHADRDEIRRQARQSQQMAGEGWAIGALLELACFYADSYERFLEDN